MKSKTRKAQSKCYICTTGPTGANLPESPAWLLSAIADSWNENWHDVREQIQVWLTRLLTGGGEDGRENPCNIPGSNNNGKPGRPSGGGDDACRLSKLTGEGVVLGLRTTPTEDESFGLLGFSFLKLGAGSTSCCVKPGTIVSTFARVLSQRGPWYPWNTPAVLITSSMFFIDSSTASFCNFAQQITTLWSLT